MHERVKCVCVRACVCTVVCCSDIYALVCDMVFSKIHFSVVWCGPCSAVLCGVVCSVVRCTCCVVRAYHHLLDFQLIVLVGLC